MAAPQPTLGTRASDRHSTVVKMLRWILPALAVLLLASIFFLSTSNKVRQGIIIADAKLKALASGQIDNPNFSGVTSSGDAFTISALAAVPDGPTPEKIDLEAPRTTIDFENGRRLETVSGSGLLDLNTSEATLSGDVDLQTSNGYTAQSPELLINFETGNVYSIGSVVAEGPIGSIEAGSMSLLQNLDENPEGNAVLIFTDGVKLIYTAQNE
ncbi:MAG: LPS export ABC transporter periplasmic protein LptC [Pseudomonadota bacterium]